MAQRESKRRPSGAVTPQEQVWRERLEAWRSSGLTQVAFCRREGLSEGNLGWWKRELIARERRRTEAPAGESSGAKTDEKPVRWVQIPAMASRAEAAQGGEGPRDGGFELVLRGERRVRLGADFDAGGLRRLVAVLESLPC